jgi:serine/threonine-protein kinase
MARTIDPSRDLLFALLALQNGLIDQAQLVSGFQAWTREKSRSMADLLVSRGDLEGDDRGAVEALVARHLKKHGGDPNKSLAAINAGRSTCESLARVCGGEIESSLAQVGVASTLAGGDRDRTATYSVGTATSEGQRFRVLRPHARGGLGAVFVALDTELHREVALKQILDQHADDPISRQRFLLEAEVTGGLEHPGIVPVYGLGTQGDGRPFYAMRFIRGDSLKEAIEQFHADASPKNDRRRRSLELRKLLHRFTDVCNAIEYAHSRGVLHRDIKPGNVIVGKHGETLVVDWGLAKPLGHIEPGRESGERTLVPSSGSGSSSTLPGSALGTPAYMSPEQAEGDLEHLGPRSDVYSLGATLYCLLTGKPPFEGDAADVMRDVQKGRFAPPRQVDPTIDRALESVCLKAMALKPIDRYDSPKAMAEDVERWMADESVSSWREPLPRTLIRWLTRHRVGVTAAGAAVLVALAGLAAVLGVQTQANAALKRANIDLAIANTRVTRANVALAASNDRERARFALAQEAIRTFHAGVSEDVLLKQEEFKALRTKLLRGAAEFYRKLEGLLQGHEDRDSRLSLGRAYLEVGELTRQLDSIEESEKVIRSALALFEDLCTENPADAEPRRALALCLKSLSLILTSTGRPDEALAALGQSREFFRTLGEADPFDRPLQAECAEAELLYGMSLLSKSCMREAIEAVERARAILEAAAGIPPAEDLLPNLADVNGALALVLEEAGRFDEARAAYQRARDLGEALFRAKPNDEQTGHELARNLGNMGIFLRDAGRRDEALVAFGRAREVLRVVREANPTIVRLPAASAWIDSAAGETLVTLGRDAEALQALERARAAREALIKANPAVVRNREQWNRVQHQIAQIYTRAGRTPEALATFERARDFAASLVDAHPQETSYRQELAAICNDLAELYGNAEKPRAAASSFEKAASILRQIVDADPSNGSSRTSLAKTLRHRGIAMQRCGRPADAAADFRRSIAVLQELKQPRSQAFYDLACGYSLLSGIAGRAGSGLTVAEGRTEADRAVNNLRRAVASGWDNAAWMVKDTELHAIRSRPEFGLMALDAAFPADPFGVVR